MDEHVEDLTADVPAEADPPNSAGTAPAPADPPNSAGTAPEAPEQAAEVADDGTPVEEAPAEEPAAEPRPDLGTE